MRSPAPESVSQCWEAEASRAPPVPPWPPRAQAPVLMERLGQRGRRGAGPVATREVRTQTLSSAPAGRPHRSPLASPSEDGAVTERLHAAPHVDGRADVPCGRRREPPGTTDAGSGPAPSARRPPQPAVLPGATREGRVLQHSILVSFFTEAPGSQQRLNASPREPRASVWVQPGAPGRVHCGSHAAVPARGSISTQSRAVRRLGPPGGPRRSGWGGSSSSLEPGVPPRPGPRTRALDIEDVA